MGWAAGFLLIVSYVIDYFSTLWNFLKPLQPLSIFDYYDPPTALAHGTIPTTNLLVLLGLAILASIAGLLVFERRSSELARTGYRVDSHGAWCNDS
ncbi:MAG: hypothetical protein R2855_11270 [Thermomicrobiales bacterium]